jgi:hypothetical protein
MKTTTTIYNIYIQAKERGYKGVAIHRWKMNYVSTLLFSTI